MRQTEISALRLTLRIWRRLASTPWSQHSLIRKYNVAIEICGRAMTAGCPCCTSFDCNVCPMVGFWSPDEYIALCYRQGSIFKEWEEGAINGRERYKSRELAFDLSIQIEKALEYWLALREMNEQ